MTSFFSLLPIVLAVFGMLFAIFGGWQLIKLVVKLNVYVQLLIDKELHE